MRLPLRFELSESVRSNRNAAECGVSILKSPAFAGLYIYYVAAGESPSYFTSRFAFKSNPPAKKNTSHITEPP